MLRVRVEVVPHGLDDQAFVTDEVWVENDGSLSGTGFGNYRVKDPLGAPDHADRGWNEPLELPSAAAAHYSETVGRIQNIKRSDEHRTAVAAKALNIVRAARVGAKIDELTGCGAK